MVISPTEIFEKNVKQGIVGLYHSWDIDLSDYHNDAILDNYKHHLIITHVADSNPNIIMGITIEPFPVYGLQFHPESYITEYGDEMIRNFCNL